MPRERDPDRDRKKNDDRQDEQPDASVSQQPHQYRRRTESAGNDLGRWFGLLGRWFLAQGGGVVDLAGVDMVRRQ
jgi:hypothetical protein